MRFIIVYMTTKIIIVLAVIFAAFTMFLPRPEETVIEPDPITRYCVIRDSVQVIPATMVWPFPESSITSPFGDRPQLGYHEGLDFGTGWNEPVPAVVAGTVVFAQWRYGYEVRVVDPSGQFTYLYAHLNRIDVVVGQYVEMGQSVGLSGSTGFSTGPHLHLEIWDNGVPVDPYPILKDRTQEKYIPRDAVTCT